MKKVILPSGKELGIGVVPFADAKALYQAILAEVKEVTLGTKSELGEMVKNLLCSSFTSQRVESVLWKCMERSTYNGQKIVPDTFEPVEAREDFMKVCSEVGKETVSPFLKNLFADFKHAVETIQSIHK